MLCAAQRVCMNRLLSRVRYGPGAASGAKLVGGPVVPSRFFSCVQKTSSELSSFFYVNGSLSHAFPSKQWHCASTLLLAHTLSNSLTNGCEAQHLPPKQSTTCTKHSPTSAACTSGETGWFRGGPPALVPALTYREEKKTPSRQQNLIMVRSCIMVRVATDLALVKPSAHANLREARTVETLEPQKNMSN